jgi:hypothetical protein
MSANWRPDDSLSERDKKGELIGERRIRAALKKNNVRFGKGVITSRDPGMAGVRRDLKRTGMPRGVEQWQIPIVLRGDVLCFVGSMKPNTIVPEHSHTHPVFRLVIDGELKFGRKILKAGDWMYVPAGVAYSIQAGRKGCWPLYAHP